MRMVTVPDHIRVILFDLDGTLVDHAGAAARASISFAQRFGVESSDIPARWDAIERRWFAEYEKGHISHTQQRIYRCREFLQRPDLSDEEALETYALYLADYERHWAAFDDAADALRSALSSYEVGIFTNGAPDMQTDKLRRTGLWDDRMTMLATTELGAAKPQMEAYERALERMEIPAENTLMIGDNFANDIAPARTVGLSALFLTRDSREGDISTLAEIVF